MVFQRPQGGSAGWQQLVGNQNYEELSTEQLLNSEEDSTELGVYGFLLKSYVHAAAANGHRDRDATKLLGIQLRDSNSVAANGIAAIDRILEPGEDGRSIVIHLDALRATPYINVSAERLLERINGCFNGFSDETDVVDIVIDGDFPTTQHSKQIHLSNIDHLTINGNVTAGHEIRCPKAKVVITGNVGKGATIEGDAITVGSVSEGVTLDAKMNHGQEKDASLEVLSGDVVNATLQSTGDVTVHGSISGSRALIKAGDTVIVHGDVANGATIRPRKNGAPTLPVIDVTVEGNIIDSTITTNGGSLTAEEAANPDRRGNRQTVISGSTIEAATIAAPEEVRSSTLTATESISIFGTPDISAVQNSTLIVPEGATGVITVEQGSLFNTKVNAPDSSLTLTAGDVDNCKSGIVVESLNAGEIKYSHVYADGDITLTGQVRHDSVVEAQNLTAKAVRDSQVTLTGDLLGLTVDDETGRSLSGATLAFTGEGQRHLTVPGPADNSSIRALPTDDDQPEAPELDVTLTHGLTNGRTIICSQLTVPASANGVPNQLQVKNLDVGALEADGLAVSPASGKGDYVYVRSGGRAAAVSGYNEVFLSSAAIPGAVAASQKLWLAGQTDIGSASGFTELVLSDGSQSTIRQGGVSVTTAGLGDGAALTLAEGHMTAATLTAPNATLILQQGNLSADQANIGILHAANGNVVGQKEKSVLKIGSELQAQQVTGFGTANLNGATVTGQVSGTKRGNLTLTGTSQLGSLDGYNDLTLGDGGNLTVSRNGLTLNQAILGAGSAVTVTDGHVQASALQGASASLQADNGNVTAETITLGSLAAPAGTVTATGKKPSATIGEITAGGMSKFPAVALGSGTITGVLTGAGEKSTVTLTGNLSAGGVADIGTLSGEAAALTVTADPATGDPGKVSARNIQLHSLLGGGTVTGVGNSASLAVDGRIEAGKVSGFQQVRLAEGRAADLRPAATAGSMLTVSGALEADDILGFGKITGMDGSDIHATRSIVAADIEVDMIRADRDLRALRPDGSGINADNFKSNPPAARLKAGSVETPTLAFWKECDLGEAYIAGNLGYVDTLVADKLEVTASPNCRGVDSVGTIIAGHMATEVDVRGRDDNPTVIRAGEWHHDYTNHSPQDVIAFNGGLQDVYVDEARRFKSFGSPLAPAIAHGEYLGFNPDHVREALDKTAESIAGKPLARRGKEEILADMYRTLGERLNFGDDPDVLREDGPFLAAVAETNIEALANAAGFKGNKGEFMEAFVKVNEATQPQETMWQQLHRKVVQGRQRDPHMQPATASDSSMVSLYLRSQMQEHFPALPDWARSRNLDVPDHFIQPVESNLDRMRNAPQGGRGYGSNTVPMPDDYPLTGAAD